MKIKPSRRTFLKSSLAVIAAPSMAVIAAPSLPAIVTPEMRFYSIAVDGDITELFIENCPEDSDTAWFVVPGYEQYQAIELMRSRIAARVRDSCSSWSPQNEWCIRVYESVPEWEVIESAKEWRTDFETTAGRLMGWQCEYDRCCDECGLYSMDGIVPTCTECYRCRPCVEDGVPWYRGINGGVATAFVKKHQEMTGMCPGCR